MAKLLLTDCDGTVRKPKSRTKFIQHPHDQKIIKGASQAIAHYARMGYTIIGVSNQGGVAKGYKTLTECVEEQEYTLELLPQLDRILFCPDYEGIICHEVSRKLVGFDLNTYNREGTDYDSFRKPGCGMLQLAMESAGEIEHCLYVGDRPEDEAASTAASVQFLWAADWIKQAGQSR
jgi:D-glycero-D-manno-heptose 1,7-bisphosphate phosphatase